MRSFIAFGSEWVKIVAALVSARTAANSPHRPYCVTRARPNANTKQVKGGNDGMWFSRPVSTWSLRRG